MVVLCSLTGCEERERNDFRQKGTGESVMENVLFERPEFILRINASEVRYFAKVNGIAIYREYDREGILEMDFPVNAYMRSGENSISLYVLPHEKGDEFDYGSEVSAELWVRPHHPKKELDGYKITDIRFDGGEVENESGTSESSMSGTFSSSNEFRFDENGDVVVKDIVIKENPEFEGAFIFTREIIIPNNLPLWAFFESDELPDYATIPDEPYAEAHGEIFKLYAAFQEALEREDIDAILMLCEERDREMDQAFYYKPGTYNQLLRESLERTINDDNLELVELPPNILLLIGEDNRKLASLYREPADPAIGCDFIEGIGSVSYPIMCRRENGTWIITR